MKIYYCVCGIRKTGVKSAAADEKKLIMCFFPSLSVHKSNTPKMLSEQWVHAGNY